MALLVGSVLLAGFFVWAWHQTKENHYFVCSQVWTAAFYIMAAVVLK